VVRHEGEAAAEFYCSVIPNSKVTEVSRYGESFP
jgi:predicted 3-demethylubiquinone-9 3-methyltransferase (glyoxalase superfamily)